MRYLIIVLSLSGCGGGGTDTPSESETSSTPYICKQSDYHFYTADSGWQCIPGSY